MRVFSIFCTYISERVFITVPDKPERGFKRYVRYRKAGRTRQAAGAGKHPPETAARHLWTECRVYAAVRGADAGGGHGRRVGATGSMGRVRRDAAAGGRGRLCAGGRRLLCRGGSDHRAVLPAQKQRKPEKERGGQAEPTQTGGKNDMKKRILSILLLCCMMLTLLPTTAFAAGEIDEQFTLAPGGTYYFDLSAMGIPGTVNDALPDKTMRYVPFTYAGTVDSYKLTSEMATTEEYAQQSKYAHSLFIADFAVTHEVSWDNLNTADLIFGKNYTAGGVDYTMRAPSAGSDSTGSGDSEHGTPQSNEWDRILDKNDGYIKNWSRMHSWGQDTSLFAWENRVIRGSYSARYWTSSRPANSRPTLGFRSVLEILNSGTLGSDGLKAVTLDLGGGKLGNSFKDIQIIVKSGDAFTAPSGDGLTRPDGNIGSYFKWLGSDGELYAPGESVPAVVTKLSAQFSLPEQFTLTPGGTYYFDLSGVSIPGTANGSLPDASLHYVPFTYAGTVDAYKLMSEMATTEEDAEQNQYPHSLFVADFAVTHTVNWNALNDASLIFGKNYAAGGVDYMLRAPSAGSDSTGSGDSEHGTPQSNEWDRILDKNGGYIKNWVEMFSWGQDTPSEDASFRAVRGYFSARYWISYATTDSAPNLGFSPVLEVLNPGTLGFDWLKVVTLDLGGGKLGSNSDHIQIIVKKGESFTAPASNGLTRPDGNTGSYFKWLGSDGKLYVPGGSVPANVNKLTAQFDYTEQFTLDPGGTYYFDLSGVNIPGTVNDALPDKTMHYVPFTYAGTVDAYKLTSEMVTTEEYAAQNKFAHSLFMADYAVTHTVSWNDLNTADLIFGKDCAAGGVEYMLRAPSVGSGGTGWDDLERATPQSNEWDKTLDKYDGYIKNWSWMHSWGQDTESIFASGRAVRGYGSARGWYDDGATVSSPRVGFRPVLEVLNPGTLGSDGLKAVTLDLGGGKLGNSSEDIQIIVKNGKSFTAPASEGLTRPDGNTGNYFKWRGSDGELYAPDDNVPADVTKLTAQFDEQFTLAPGGTYYFDLSGESIPGTADDALPDKTMHYVPFTYAGTVDAYKLTSAMAATDEYAEKNKYAHSLFVADYTVTHTVSWDELNAGRLIFGRDYAAGGVDYILRAPSVGSGSIGSAESQRGTPPSNEWDRILDKNDGYIKNWFGMFSWGQDTLSTSESDRAARGYFPPGGWSSAPASHQNAVAGFRPVLEVLSPGSLGFDGLKAVTLDLDGGKLGNSSEDIQIIVKSGESFAAPASDGLTRPDGNTDNYFKWLGSDGELYEPGDNVSADVTKLTAQFAPSSHSVTITTDTLPDGKVGEAYSQILTATGTTPIKWSISGGALPDDLSLNKDTGKISGTPTADGTAKFTVTAENSVGSDTKELSITITKAPAAEYTVTVTTEGGGTASASPAKAVAGAEITLTAMPNEGYHFKEWQVISGGVSIKNNKFTMPDSNVEVKAIFEEDAPPAPTEYTITVTNDGNGTASASHAKAAAGTEITLTAMPNEGYHFKEWQVISGDVTIVDDKFTMPDSNVEVKAIFEEDAPPAPTDPAKPSISVTGTYTYNGSEHTAAVNGYDPSTMDIAGNTATDAGDYTVRVTSKTGKWVDGSTDAVTAAWSIGKATQEAPNGLTGVAPTTEGGSDGKITGVDSTMEYRMAGESSYTACSGTEIENLSAGNYFVRYAEDNNHFAGTDAEVTVGKGAPLADCTITFDGNGGSGSMGPVTVKAGANYILPECGFTAPADQEFKAWEISGTEYKVGDSYTVLGDTEIKALWENSVITPTTYTVTVSNDGNGTGTAAPSTAAAGTTITLTATPNTGYHLKEWKVISGNVTIKDDKFTMPNDNVEVKAIFEKDAPPAPTEFIVTFDGNGGTPSVGSMTTTDQKLTSLPSASRSGSYSFDGWYTEKSGGTKITTDTVFHANTTVYAHWTYTGGGGGGYNPPVTYYTLRFETGGGSDIPSVRESYNTYIDLTKYVPTWRGHTFIGWYSERSLTNKVSGVYLTKDMTVYAGWRVDENPGTGANPFTDVSEKDWFYGDVMFVYENGLMLGTSKTLFSPHGTATRGMMATILWRMEGSPVPKGKNSFTDVEAGKWYADAITWTAENGIFAGYGKDKFGPDDPITREQLAAIFYRYADYKGYDLTVKGNLDKFKDADKITDYAKTAMQWAVDSGLMKGKSGNLLDPQGTATRAEIAAMLHRFIEKYELVQGKAPGGRMGWMDPKQLQIPKTGDSSVLGLWGISLCTSLAGCLALTAWKIRRRE